MRNTFTFVGQVSLEDEVSWINEINQNLKNIEVIPFRNLTIKQKQTIKLAIVANPKPSEIAELTQLEWVQSLWSGVERLLTEIPNKQLKIVRMIDPELSSTMAEAVLAWTLYLHRDMPKYRQQQQQQIWQQHKLMPISDRQIGILGLGQLGKATAIKLQKNGFTVSGWSRNPTTINNVQCFHGKNGLEKILSKTQILVCLLPLTNETKGLLNTETILKLPKNASIINFSRGPIVNQESLINCLENRHLDHAVLDVFNSEPLAKNNPLWQSPYVTVLPHISAPTNIQSAAKLAALNIQNYFDKGDIPKAIKRTDGY